MILPENQLKRFFRHIIMPEIGGPGQKKLLESGVKVYAASAEDVKPLLYYLTAVGIGKISYGLANSRGIQKLIYNLKNLNPDVIIAESGLYNSEIPDNRPSYKLHDGFQAGIILGSRKFISDTIELLSKSDNIEIPLITAVIGQWQGVFRVLKQQEKLSHDLFKMDVPCSHIDEHFASEGKVLSSCFLGALAAVETVKLCLNIGKSQDKPLFFDLMSMTFSRREGVFKAFKDTKSLKPIREKLSDASVLIVGVGGLGSPAAFALASIGVGTVGLVDGDRVELTNLNRQILHATSGIGMPKVESARRFLKELNPSVNIITYYTNLTRQNAFDLIKDYDVIIVGLDNLPSRYLLNDACFFTGKPLIEAGVLRFSGMGRTILPKAGPCYRCIFPEMPPPGSIPSCQESGILGAVPGVMGFIEAAEATKLLSGAGEVLKNRLLLFDAMDSEFRVPSFRRDPRCPLCGKAPSITGLQEYESICEKD